MKYSIFSSLLMAAITVGTISAKTITVSKTTPADFTEIQAALDSFGGVKDLDGTPNVINILDNSAYEEVITVKVHCSIIGDPVNRPRILVMKNDFDNSIGTTGAFEDGISINIPLTSGTTGTTELKNLIIIPSRTSTPPDDAIITTTHNGFIHFDNLLITANNGSDQPVTIDGLSEVDLTGATHFGDDGIFTGTAWEVGNGHEFLLTNSVITHNRGQAASDGVITTGTSGRAFTIGDGNVISYNGRLGVQSGGPYTIFYSKIKPTLILGNKGFSGIWYAGAPTVEYTRTIDGIVVTKNTGSGVEHNSGGDKPFVIKNSIFSENAINLLINNTTTNGNTTIDRVTMAKPTTGSPTFRVVAGSNSNITIKNSILAGNGSADVKNVIDHNGGGTLTLEGTAIVTAGPFALNSATNAGTGIVSGVASTTADPSFVQTANPKLTGFFDVASGQYSNVNATSGPLGGGAKYVGPSSSVSDWNLF